MNNGMSEDVCVCMQMAALPNNSKLLQDMIMAQLTEHGKFSELLSINVPCPVDPDITLVSVIPEVCSRESRTDTLFHATLP